MGLPMVYGSKVIPEGLWLSEATIAFAVFGFKGEREATEANRDIMFLQPGKSEYNRIVIQLYQVKEHVGVDVSIQIYSDASVVGYIGFYLSFKTAERTRLLEGE